MTCSEVYKQKLNFGVLFYLKKYHFFGVSVGFFTVFESFLIDNYLVIQTLEFIIFLGIKAKCLYIISKV